MAKRRKQKELVIKAKPVYKSKQLELFELGGEVLYQSKKQGEKLTKSDYITYLRTGIVSRIFFDKKTGQSHTHVEMDLDKLDRFVQKAKKAREEWKVFNKERQKKGYARLPRVFWRHLNEELSFLFKY